MNPSYIQNKARFVIATPGRSVCDHFARYFSSKNLLRRYIVGTRRGTAGIPSELTRLFPLFGLLNYVGAKTLSPYHSEAFRFFMHPMFDHYAKMHLQEGDWLMSSYGYANASFKWLRRNGGKIFIDGGNSHPENFRKILTEEYRRWQSPVPPLPDFYHERNIAMLENVDYVCAPSSFVANSFLERGFEEHQILRNFYPIDLNLFTPPVTPRPQNRPLTVISTGRLTLRKGFQYLLPAFKTVLKQVPNARLLLTSGVMDDFQPVMEKYNDLPIDWSPNLPHQQLAERLLSADIFVLPSLEEGFARTAAEAMACGLPVILTPNTGVNDLVKEDINGSVIPIREPQAIADAILKWWERINGNQIQPIKFDRSLLSVEAFNTTLAQQLAGLGL